MDFLQTTDSIYGSSCTYDLETKSVHLQFCMNLNEKRLSYVFEFLGKEAYLDMFSRLKQYLQDHPKAEIDEFYLSFSPEVRLDLCIPNSIVVDYDRDGPIFEDEEWVVRTQEVLPSTFLFQLDDESHKDLQEIGEALLDLLSVHSWKAISLPYHFPSAGVVADLYPFATFTEEVDEEESYKMVDQLLEKLHREHRKI